MTILYLEQDQDGPVQAHRNPPVGKTVVIVEIEESFNSTVVYGKVLFTGDDTFLSPSQGELVLWADGRGPVEINIIPVVD